MDHAITATRRFASDACTRRAGFGVVAILARLDFFVAAARSFANAELAQAGARFSNTRRD